MNKSEETYTYFKKRKDFGKQPVFSQVRVHLLDSIEPNAVENKEYCLRNPVNQEVQATTILKKNYINTKRVIMREKGVNHAEGGWPKDINFTDEEQTSRYRRRFERDDAYVEAILGSYSKIEHNLNQNNAIDMYDMYFKNLPAVLPVEKSSLQINNIYKDPENRPIASIHWTYEDDSKLVVAYCDKKYPVTQRMKSRLTGFVWNMENPYDPCSEFEPPSACWQAVTSPVHPSIIVGGLEDGRVCIFDLRAKNVPVCISTGHFAHRDPVCSLVYIQSRLNFEFFSGSADGNCKWWDVRDLSSPIDALIITVKATPGDKVSLANSEAVSALQYEKSFPTKFLCGTDTGKVVSVNRKGKTHNEVISAVYEAHKGPVRAVHRSPCTSKMFITCGDWTVNIWSEDVEISSIIPGKPHRYQINDVAWSPQRLSSYISVCADGKLRYWDLLRKYHEPLIMIQLSHYPLLKIKPNELGNLVATGDAKGALSLISLSNTLVVSGENDKQLMLQIYERETRRERILEARVKEIRLKFRVDEEVGPQRSDFFEGEADVIMAEAEYKRLVGEEFKQASVPASRMRDR